MGLGRTRQFFVLALVASPACIADETTPSIPGKVASKPAPLDLKIPDIQRYFDAAELAMPLPEGLEEIIVNGQRPEPLPERRVLPQGALGALIYAGTHPLDAWRILVPDPNFKVPDRSEDEAKDPPGAFRGRILDPGAIYD